MIHNSFSNIWNYRLMARLWASDILVVLAVATLSVILVNGQIGTPCTTSMVSSFTPCINFITGSTSNGAPPTAGCCSFLASLTSTSVDCACLLVNGNVPFQLPINRTLAISLPRACKMPGVPLQCKDSGTPLAAPGPALLGSASAPVGSAAFAPQGPALLGSAPAPVDSAAFAPQGPALLGSAPAPVGSVASAPQASKASSSSSSVPTPDQATPEDLAPSSEPVGTIAPTATPEDLTPSSEPVGTIAPTATPGIRPVLTPSTASKQSHIASTALFLLVAATAVVF